MEWNGMEWTTNKRFELTRKGCATSTPSPHTRPDPIHVDSGVGLCLDCELFCVSTGFFFLFSFFLSTAAVVSAVPRRVGSTCRRRTAHGWSALPGLKEF